MDPDTVIKNINKATTVQKKPDVPADLTMDKVAKPADAYASGSGTSLKSGAPIIDPSEYTKLGYDPDNPLAGLTQAASQAGKSSQDVMDAMNALAQKRQEGRDLQLEVPASSLGISSTPLASTTANLPLPADGSAVMAPEDGDIPVAPSRTPGGGTAKSEATPKSDMDWSWLGKLGTGAMGVLGNALQAVADSNSTRADQPELTSVARNQAKQLQAAQLANAVELAKINQATQQSLPMLSSEADINTAGGVLPYQLQYLREAYKQMLEAYGGIGGTMGTRGMYNADRNGYMQGLLNGQVQSAPVQQFQIPNSMAELKSSIPSAPRLK